MSNPDTRYITPSKIQESYGISTSTLRRWDKDGKVETIRTPGGYRLYSEHDIQQLFHQSTQQEQKEKKLRQS